jgi:glycosyltransferase involved in cell wall biosynthesis
MGGNDSAPGTHRVSIGLPVYNGDNFVEQAIESVLAQTFTDFELIISDNASTDKTEDICRTCAARDRRIRYTRNAENIGLVRNYNSVFALASGEYFKWADHDDLCEPDFLMRCVQALDEDPSVVLAYARALTIDATGRRIKEWAARPELTSSNVALRFRRALKPDEPFPQQGLIRADVLRRTGLLGNHVQSDILLLAEISLQGRFVEIPQPLFMVREHPQRSTRTHNWENPQTMIAWMDPGRKNSFSFLEWGLLARVVAAVHRAPLKWSDRWRCYREVYTWIGTKKRALVRDVVFASQGLPGVGNVPVTLYWKYKRMIWNHRMRQFSKDVVSVIPLNDRFILVDEAKLPPGLLGDMKTVPFLERDGQYWGVPANDDTAIRDVERLRQSGVSFMVFAWPSFWWLEFYLELNRYLRSRFRCVLQNGRLVVFDLRHGPEMV